MGTEIAAEIYIGGTLPAELLAEFLEACDDECVLSDIVEGDLTLGLQLLRDLIDEDGHLKLEDDSANYGELPHLEGFCRAHGLFYLRHREGREEYEPGWAVLGPGMKTPKWIESKRDGIVTLDADDVAVQVTKLTKIRKRLATAVQKKKPVSLERLLGEVSAIVNALDVGGLPNIPPIELPESVPDAQTT